MKKGIFPSKLSELNSYFGKVLAYLTANKDRLKISDTSISGIAAFFVVWTENYNLSNDANTSTSTSRTLRDNFGDDLKGGLRTIYNDISRSLFTTADYNTLNISPRNSKPVPAPVPKNAPLVMVSAINHLVHTVRCVNPESPKRASKPVGVKSILLFQAISKTNVMPETSAFALVVNSGRGIIRVQFDMKDAGSTAFYYAVYVNAKGEKSTVSDIISAVIA